MSQARIQQSVERVSQYFSANPDKALSSDAAASAVVERGLRCSVSGAGGASIATDMPKGIGGEASAPTPGWYLRAALAACDATVIAMRAAQLGIELRTLEVSVDSISDDRGLLGLGDAVLPGPQSVRTRVRIGAEGASDQQLRQIVEWAEQHSPVGDAIRRAVPTRLDIESV